MSHLSYQQDDNGVAVAQKQSGEVGAADVNIASATISLPVAGLDPNGQQHTLALNVDGGLTGSYGTLTNVARPGNATAYAAGDNVGGLFEIKNAGPAGGLIAILAATMIQQIASVPVGQTSFRMYLYNKPPAAIADNGVWTLPVADVPNYCTYIDLGTPAANGVSGVATLMSKTGPLGGEPVKLAPGSTSLWAYVVTNGGYTPAANGEVYTYLLLSAAL